MLHKVKLDIKSLICIFLFFIMFGLSSCEKKNYALVENGVINCNYYIDHNVSFLGDSITELSNDSNGFIQLLDEHFHFKKVNNYGISGTTVSGASRVNAFYTDSRTNVIDIQTNLLFVFGGINDCVNKLEIGNLSILNKNTDTFIGAYNVLIDKLLNSIEGCKIVLISPHYVDVENIGLYSNAVNSVAELNKLDCINLYKDSNISESDYDDYTIDGVHLNYDGNLEVAKCIAKYLIESVPSNQIIENNA